MEGWYNIDLFGLAWARLGARLITVCLGGVLFIYCLVLLICFVIAVGF